MHAFPRTMIEGLSVPRLIIGTNWMLGFSHSSRAKDKAIIDGMTDGRIAAILEVFFRGGVDALLGFRVDEKLEAGIREAEQRTGVRCIRIATPGRSSGVSPGDSRRSTPASASHAITDEL